MTIKNTAKGRSTSATRVSEFVNPRIASKDCRLLTKAPVEAGFSLNEKPSTFCIKFAVRVISIRLAASSTKKCRSIRNENSANSTIAAPIASTHNVSVAAFGTTLSYTFITNSGMARDSSPMNIEASNTSLYSETAEPTVCQSQCTPF